MMGAASLPNPQASMPAGFAAFLSTIGQTPSGSGEDGGFEQLLAAVPKVDGAGVKAAPAAAVLPAPSGAPATPALPAMTVTPVTSVTPMMTATPVTSAASEMPMTPVTPAAAAVVAAVVVAPAAAAGDVAAPEINVEAPMAMTKDAAPTTDADTAAASAAKLLIALNGSAAKPETKPLKALDTEAPTDGKAVAETGSGVAKPAETAAAPETLAATPAPPPAAPSVAASPAAAAVVAAVVVAAPEAAASQGKPMKASEPGKLPVADTAPTAATVATASAPAADKPRSAEATRVAPEIESAIAAPAASKPRAAPQPGPAVIAGEAVAAKPTEVAPAMTVQFAQPTSAGAATLASAAAPVTIAERVLDLASDGAWIDQLAHDIAATKSDSGDISFRLMPRHLGRLDVAMLVGDEGVALKLDTQHEATATIVTAAQGRLVEDLRQQGVRVTGSEVTCTPGDTGRQMQGQSQGQARGAAQDVSHLIETVTERVKARDPEEAADRRGRFA